MRSSATLLVASSLALFSLAVGMPAGAVLLYDVDFGSPPHTVGAPPVTGTGPAPRATPTSINFGDPTVVASMGVLINQPCSFGNGTAGYDQLQFVCGGPSTPGGFPNAYDYYRIEFEVLVEQLAGTTFRFFLDTPSANSISFRVDNTIMIWPGNQIIGNYAFGVPLLLAIDLDLLIGEWTISLDGVPAYTGPITATELRTVRMNLDGGSSTDAGAVDNFRVYGGEPPPPDECDVVDFDDLTLGATYNAGDFFVSNGVMVEVGEFYYSLGPCVPPTTSNLARVDNAGLACGSGREIEVNNVTLHFDFGSAVTEVALQYGEYGGTVDLGINGVCRVVQNFADLDGVALGGVTVHVVDFGVPGQSCGVLLLEGTVDALTIGGQELWVDNVFYCRPCVLIAEAKFEDQPLGMTFSSGAAFNSGDLVFHVSDFYYTLGPCGGPTTSNHARIDNNGMACGSGQDLEVNNVNLGVEFTGPAVQVVLAYGEYGGQVDLGVNGDCRVVNDFADLNGAVLGGVTVHVIDFGQPGQSCGRLYFSGVVTDLLIGGQELWIDDVYGCVVTDAVGDDGGHDAVADLGRRVMLHQNTPNPFNPATTIEFDVHRGGEITLRIYDIGGHFVRALVEGEMPAGTHAVTWNGLDAGGRRVPGGVYLYQLETGGTSVTRRMVMLK